MPAVSSIVSVLKSFDILMRLGKAVRPLHSIKKIFNSEVSVDLLADHFFEGNTTFGDQVRVKGVLSRYGYLYKPRAYPKMVAYKSRYVKPKVGETGTSYETVFRMCQYPIQRLNTFTGQDKNYNICFLYPEDFTSFLMNVDNSEFQSRNISFDEFQLKVEPTQKPIVLIIEENALDRHGEKIVSLSGVIRKLPEEFIEEIENNYDQLKSIVYNNSFRPFSEGYGFCIDCRNFENEMKADSKSLHIDGCAYAEAHIEGINEVLPREFFNDVMPIPRTFKNVIPIKMGENNPVSSFNVPGNVQISIHDENILGFFTNINLTRTQVFNQNLSELIAKYKKLDKNLQAKFKATGLKGQLKVDFIYDNRRQNLFKKNLLDSNEIDKIIENDQSLEDVINWLQQRK